MYGRLDPASFHIYHTACKAKVALRTKWIGLRTCSLVLEFICKKPIGGLAREWKYYIVPAALCERVLNACGLCTASHKNETNNNLFNDNKAQAFFVPPRQSAAAIARIPNTQKEMSMSMSRRAKRFRVSPAGILKYQETHVYIQYVWTHIHMRVPQQWFCNAYLISKYRLRKEIPTKYTLFACD